MAIKTPINPNLTKCFLGIALALNNTPGKTIKLNEVNPTRHHTNQKAVREIKSPNIAVNPHRKIARCNCRYAFFT